MHRLEPRIRVWAAVMLIVVVLFAFPAGSVSAHRTGGYSHASGLGIDNSDWMADLPDTVKVSELSLPGTHDSMAWQGDWAAWGGDIIAPIVRDVAQTQSMDLRTQLESGIRVFDMRLVHVENYFLMYHGPVPLNTSFGKDVMDVVVDFLDDHPDEVVFLGVAKNSPSTNNPEGSFDDVFKVYLERYKDYIWLPPASVSCFPADCALGTAYNPYNPTLGDVRGKIVFIDGLGLSRAYGIPGSDVEWNNGPVFHKHISQNYWDLDTKSGLFRKWDLINRALYETVRGDPYTFYYNYLSGSTNCTNFETIATYAALCLDVPYPYFVASGHESPGTDAPHLVSLTTYVQNEYFVSAPCPFPDTGLCVVYEGTNVLTMNEINSDRLPPGRVGIIYADFPGAGLIEAVINRNDYVPQITAAVTPGEINENGKVTLTGSIIDSNEEDTFEVTIKWGDGAMTTIPQAGLTEGATAGELLYSVQHTYVDDAPSATPSDTYTLDVQVKDAAGNIGTASPSLTVTVNNVAPVVTASVAASEINEGGEVTISGKITDPGIALDEFDIEIDWGDGNTSQPVLTRILGDHRTGSSYGTYSVTHQYLDDSPPDGFPIAVKVKDDDGGVGTANTTVTVKNVAPTVEQVQLSETTIDENGEVTLSGTFSDPGTLDNPFTVDISWGDGNTDTNVEYDPETKAFSKSHQYLDDGLTDQPSDDYEITVIVVDKDGGEGRANTTVTVNNVAPAVTLDGPTYLIKGQTFQGSGSFDDPGTLDTWTATVDYGDGSDPQELTLTGITFTLSNTYTTVGTPAVEVCVTDDDQGGGCSSLQVEIISFQQAASDLCGLVEGLKNEGVLNNGQVNSLCAKLNAASQQLDNENDATAIQQIEAFINEVQAHVESDKLTPEQGQALTDQAQVIIALIRDAKAGGFGLTGAAMGDASTLTLVGIMMGVLAIGGLGYAIWTRFKRRNAS